MSRGKNRLPTTRQAMNESLPQIRRSKSASSHTHTFGNPKVSTLKIIKQDTGLTGELRIVSGEYAGRTLDFCLSSDQTKLLSKQVANLMKIEQHVSMNVGDESITLMISKMNSNYQIEFFHAAGYLKQELTPTDLKHLVWVLDLN